MGVRYQIQNQVLGTYTAPMVVAEYLQLVVVNLTGGVNLKLSWEDNEGRGSNWTVRPGGAFHDTGWYRNFTITGTGATVEGGFFMPEDVVDVPSLLIGGSSTDSVQTTGIAALALTAKTVYTCPVGKRAYLLQLTVHETAADTVTIAANRGGGAPGANQQSDFISATGGTAVPAGGNLYVGCGPGETIQLPAGGFPLVAGDIVWVQPGANNATINLEVFEVPI